MLSDFTTATPGRNWRCPPGPTMQVSAPSTGPGSSMRLPSRTQSSVLTWRLLRSLKIWTHVHPGCAQTLVLTPRQPGFGVEGKARPGTFLSIFPLSSDPRQTDQLPHPDGRRPSDPPGALVVSGGLCEAAFTAGSVCTDVFRAAPVSTGTKGRSKPRAEVDRPAAEGPGPTPTTRAGNPLPPQLGGRVVIWQAMH